MQKHLKILNKGPYSFHYDDPLCLTDVEKTILSFILEMNQMLHREIVYLCIGTDRATGDCLGPLVGTRLKSLLGSAHVYGTLEHPVHATNLEAIIADIFVSYNRPFIIAVDACLGSIKRVGYINIKRGSLKPGTALKKTLPEVGDFHVSGVVNVGGFIEHMVLQNTRLHTVYKMADIIARALYLVHRRLEQTQTGVPVAKHSCQ